MEPVMPTMASLQKLESLDIKSSKTETTANAVIRSIKIRVVSWWRENPADVAFCCSIGASALMQV
jgi:hypothetical protein